MDFITWLPVIISSVVSIGSFLILWRKATPEIQKIRTEAEVNEAKANSDEAAAAESYARAADMVAKQMIEVQKEVRELRKEVDERDRIIEARDKIILDQRIMIDDLTDWATRLSFQVQSLGGKEPVPFRPKSKDPTTPPK